MVADTGGVEQEFDEDPQEHSSTANDNSTFVHALRDMTGSRLVRFPP